MQIDERVTALPRISPKEKRLEHVLMILSALGFLSMASIYLLFI